MGDSSVMIRPEKVLAKILVDDKQQACEKELVYEARKDIVDGESQENAQSLYPITEIFCRAVGVSWAA